MVRAFTADVEVRALVATRYAELVDRAAAAGDDAAMVKAGDKLLEVLVPFGVSAGGATGGGDGERARLVRVLDSGPTLGNASHG